MKRKDLVIGNTYIDGAGTKAILKCFDKQGDPVLLPISGDIPYIPYKNSPDVNKSDGCFGMHLDVFLETWEKCKISY